MLLPWYIETKKIGHLCAKDFTINEFISDSYLHASSERCWKDVGELDKRVICTIDIQDMAIFFTTSGMKAFEIYVTKQF
jgi:hypothetical protein